MSLNFSQEGERQIGTECIPETKTISSNMFGQYLDANSSWKKLNSTKQSIFRVHKKAQGISLKVRKVCCEMHYSQKFLYYSLEGGELRTAGEGVENYYLLQFFCL